jgi:hypothetical protein
LSPAASTLVLVETITYTTGSDRCLGSVDATMTAVQTIDPIPGDKDYHTLIEYTIGSDVSSTTFLITYNYPSVTLSTVTTESSALIVCNI